MAGKNSIEEVVGRTDYELFEDEELAKRYEIDDRQLLSEGTDLLDYMEPLNDDNGLARYGSMSKHILRDETIHWATRPEMSF